MPGADPALEILLPVHNEAESIEATIREIYAVVSPLVATRFIVCEDGSVDGTQQVLVGLSKLFPMRLSMSDDRRGYSRAVIDGMKLLEAPYVLCLDSDGQCDPNDFAKFWETRDRHDVAIGWRVKRCDGPLRRTLSRAFYHIYQLFYHVPAHDPSCPFVLATKRVIERIVPDLGEMKQGFWWEFTARIYRGGYSLRELPVNHRKRAAGQTQVYRLGRMPGIGLKHFKALFKIWAQTREKP
jgi:dolichol-phosphate mannosyltransferase